MHIDIMFGILLTLIRHKQTTAKYLANKFEVSERTIYRYLTVLDSNNIPITTKRGKCGGIRLNNAIPLNSVFFSASEKVALLSLTHQIENAAIKVSVQTKLLALQ